MMFTDANSEKHVEMLRERTLLRTVITLMGSVRERRFAASAEPETIMDDLLGPIHELGEFEDRKGAHSPTG